MSVTAAERGVIQPADLESVVTDVMRSTPFVDMHTHLVPASFGALGLWGIDDLLTYHYLEAELFRFSSAPTDEYFALDAAGKADAIWRTLFVENTPLSEATRGVVAVLHAFGLDATEASLDGYRRFFRAQPLDAHIDRVFALAGISSVVMTNDPLDPQEAPLWMSGVAQDSRFRAALRIDRVLNDWPDHWRVLASQGYAVTADAGGATLGEVRRFFADWAKRMRPVYMAVSLPDSFGFPHDDLRTSLLRGAVLPACRDLGLPLSLMIGVRRRVNPRLRLAGDAVGKADLTSLERLCDGFPENRFLVSVLSRENQHELCVYARKFRNLLPFGCWWFLNNPSVVEEITRERMEMLGLSFIPQHSDARVLEQVIYKWRNSRRTVGPILSATYQRLAEDGRLVTRHEIQRDVELLFRGNFERWMA